MGKRGPAPTPTETLKKRGSWRANERKNEPQPERKIPDCPDWLSPEAAEVWNQAATLLDGMGVLTVADGNALARYCVLWVRWKRAAIFVQSAPSEFYEVKSLTSGGKSFKPIPQVGTLNTVGMQLLKLEQQFGLTPSARTQIQVNVPPAGDDDMAEILGFTVAG